MTNVAESFKKAGFAILLIELPEGCDLTDVNVPVGAGAALVDEQTAVAYALDARLLTRVRLVPRAPEPVVRLYTVLELVRDRRFRPLTRSEAQGFAGASEHALIAEHDDELVIMDMDVDGLIIHVYRGDLAWRIHADGRLDRLS